MRDCSSRLEAIRLLLHDSTSPKIRVSFSCGRLKVMACVSTWIPRKVRQVVGPSVLCVATDTPDCDLQRSGT